MSDTTATIDGNDYDAIANTLILDQVDTSLEREEEVVEEADAQDDEQVEYDAADDDAEEAEASDHEDDEDSEDDADLDEEPAETLYTVKVDGREQQVSLDEALRSYSGQQAIQRRFEEVANARKEVEQVYHALQAEMQQAQQLRQQLERGGFTAPPTPPDDAMFKDDPIGYMEAKIAYDKQAAEWQQQQQALQQQTVRQQQMQQQALQAHLQSEMQVLVQEIPELGDAKQAPQVKEKLVQTGLAYGFSPEALDQITDAKAVRVLYDAMKYRELMGAKGEAERRVAKARPVVKPGAKPPNKSSKVKRAEKAKSRMKQTGSVDDVANFLLS